MNDGARARHGIGRPASAWSSRSLVLALVGSDGLLRASDAFDVGAALGYTVHQIRLVLARLVDEGLLASVGRGRDAVFTTTERHDHVHGPEPEWLEIAFRQDDGEAPWDGMWRTISFTLGEDRKSQRNELREAVTALGAALVMPGLYVHASDWTPWLDDAIERLEVRDAVVTSEISRWTVRGLEAPRAIAAHLWPLHEIADGYTGFVTRHESSARLAVDHDEVPSLAEAVRAVADFERCIRNDPLLPYELLPEDWPGRRAREILVDIAAQLRTARAQAGLPGLFARYDAAISRRVAAVTVARRT